MTTSTIPGPHGNIFVQVHGPDTSGTPLLVVNGGPGAAHGYLHRLSSFANDRPVIFYDQLGTGESEQPNDPSLWTVANIASELTFVRQHLGLDRVHLYSHSAGSAYATQHILDGGVVESHVMLSPMLSSRRYNADSVTLRKSLSESDQRIIEQTEGDSGFATKVYPTDLPDDYVEVTHRFAGQHWCRMQPPPEAAIDAFGNIYGQLYQTLYGPEFFFIRGTLHAAEQIELLAKVTTPTCIISGEYDWIMPTTIQAIADELADCEHHVLPDCGHLSHLERPEEHDIIVNAFLSQVGSPA
jgi:proline iminopeptidase